MNEILKLDPAPGYRVGGSESTGHPPVNPDTLAERCPPPPADLVQSSQDGEHPAIHAKRAEGKKAVKMPKGKETLDRTDLRPATVTDLRVGAEVWYEVCAGGKFYKGQVEGPAMSLPGGVLVPVRDMDPEYGGRAIAAPLSCIFVRRKEAADGN